MRGSGRVEEYDNGRRALIRTSFVSMLAGMGIVVDPSYVELIIRAILASGVDFTGRRMQADEGVTITVQMTMPDSPPISVADIRSNFATPAVQNVVRSTLASVAGVTVTEMIVTAEPRESGGGLSGLLLHAPCTMLDARCSMLDAPHAFLQVAPLRRSSSSPSCSPLSAGTGGGRRNRRAP